MMMPATLVTTRSRLTKHASTIARASIAATTYMIMLWFISASLEQHRGCVRLEGADHFSDHIRSAAQDRKLVANGEFGAH
jgi:hypothetical protein